MNNKRGLLYPALHKFYCALSSLEKFEKGTNFFDNIGYLDNFFSEYRNITFVLQHSLAHTDFLATYQKLRNEYLINSVGKWFVEKRNEVLKQQPFDLEKRIVITIYSAEATVSLPELVFTIDNDVEISTIVESLRETFMSLRQLEVMFSAEFFFYEQGHTEDMYDNFIFGINQMKLLLEALKQAINDHCKLSDELESKIEMMNFYRVPKDFLLVDDYVFFAKKGAFEKASRVAMWAGPGQGRSPIENLNKAYPNGDLFSKFELMHLVIFQLQKTLMPTCLVVYSDNTFELLSFGFSIKTTVYRKFNEIAKHIEADAITDVLFVTEMYVYDLKHLNKDTRERVKHAKNEILAFYMVDKELAMKAHAYDSNKVNDFKYIVSVMFAKSVEPELPYFINPVIHEFDRLKSKKEGTVKNNQNNWP